MNARLQDITIVGYLGVKIVNNFDKKYIYKLILDVAENGIKVSNNHFF